MATATATCQVLFKKTLSAVGAAPTIPGAYASYFMQLLLAPQFLAGLFLYGLAFLLWIYLLSRTSLALVYPIGIAINVIVTLAAARFFLGEALTPVHIVGVIVIFVGIFIVSYH